MAHVGQTPLGRLWLRNECVIQSSHGGRRHAESTTPDNAAVALFRSS
jgi:hypothetical protein